MNGFDVGELHSRLFDYQADIIRWACRRGRAAIFADTGLGKTAMQVIWADQVAKHTNGRVLILSPLAVAQQTVKEASLFGVEITYRRQDLGDRLTITNYEMMSAFDSGNFVGIVLDESSILKSFTGKIRNSIIEGFQNTAFRLACTATPAPNDHTELGNHSEFLGIKSRTEMLAEYFVHDLQKTQDWRLKRHATDTFWKWIATWAAIIKDPSDLGYDSSKFKLPQLTMHERIVEVNNRDAWGEGYLFAPDVRTLSDQRATRRATMRKRVDATIDILRQGEGQMLIWCELNDEGDMLQKAIEGSRQVKGADDQDIKSRNLLEFADGAFDVLITKAKIAGFGMNWQRCNRMVFIGASHSFEQTYQAIRRCWRFGQKKPVDVYIIRANTEDSIMQNYKRKEADAERMTVEMKNHVADILKSEIRGTVKEWNDYNPQKKMKIPSWMEER